MTGGEWSIWAGDQQMRWSAGRVLGNPELVNEIQRVIGLGGVVAITPTGPFLEASLDDPLVVSMVAQQVLKDWGYDAEIGSSPNAPTPPPIPEGAVG